MNVDATLETGAQLARKPGMRALDHPAVAPEPVIALDALAGDAILDTSVLEVGTASRIVVALVRMQLVRPAARPAALATHRWQCVNQLLKHHSIVEIGARDTEHQRDALAIRDEVVLAAKFPPVRGVGARVWAPPGAGHAGAAEVKLVSSAQFGQQRLSAEVQLAYSNEEKQSGLSVYVVIPIAQSS